MTLPYLRISVIPIVLYLMICAISYICLFKPSQNISLSINSTKEIDIEIFYRYGFLGLSDGRSKRWNEKNFINENLLFENQFFLPVDAIRADFRLRSERAYVDLPGLTISNLNLLNPHGIIIDGNMLLGQKGNTISILLEIGDAISANVISVREGPSIWQNYFLELLLIMFGFITTIMIAMFWDIAPNND